MQPWAVEHGTLWAIEMAGQSPPLCTTRVAAAFAEVSASEVAELAAAMELPTPAPAHERLRAGRRAFALRVDGRLAAYGWMTRGKECVGELERTFHLRDDEAYIWDCATLPGWRGQGFYSALLSQILRQLGRESLLRIWIGASRLNQPSVRGIANAGFAPVVDVDYRRLYRLTSLWIRVAPGAARPLVAAAYRILINAHERRIGPLALGYKYL
jgi:GNAT superfamily N-acetyltransferase